jgi:hypothetical protein
MYLKSIYEVFKMCLIRYFYVVNGRKWRWTVGSFEKSATNADVTVR